MREVKSTVRGAASGVTPPFSEKEVSSGHGMARITIITNTFQRPVDLVEKSIRSSLAQRLGPADEGIEVVLVDQNEIPLRLSEEVESNPRFKHQISRVSAVSMARNSAQYGADCDWLIFCDDDGYLKADYLERLKACWVWHPEVELFAGGIRRTDTGDFYSRRHALGGDMKWFWNTKLLMGSNFAVKRAVFEGLGKFDEAFGAGAPLGSSEETDFAWKAYFAGKKMIFAPELVVFHVPPYALGSIEAEVQKAYRYGIGKGALVRKWLGRGKFWVSLEAVEMLALPLVRMALDAVFLRSNHLRIQWAAFRGRLRGWAPGGVKRS